MENNLQRKTIYSKLLLWHWNLARWQQNKSMNVLHLKQQCDYIAAVSVFDI